MSFPSDCVAKGTVGSPVRTKRGSLETVLRAGTSSLPRFLVHLKEQLGQSEMFPKSLEHLEDINLWARTFLEREREREGKENPPNYPELNLDPPKKTSSKGSWWSFGEAAQCRVGSQHLYLSWYLLFLKYQHFSAQRGFKTNQSELSNE